MQGDYDGLRALIEAGMWLAVGVGVRDNLIGKGWGCTAAVRKAALPGKSSAPHISTMSRPMGRPIVPSTNFCSPGLLCTAVK